MKSYFLLSVFALLLCGASEAYCATLAAEDFEDYAAGGQIHGLSGGQGFTGAWDVPVAARRPEFTVVNGGLNYSNGGITINGGDRAAQYAATESGIAILGGRSFPAQSSAIYLSFLYNQSVENGNDDFMQLGFDTAPGNNPRVTALDRNGEFQLRSTTSAANSVGTGVTSTPGETFFLVLKAEKTGGSSTYNDLTLWVDPDSSSELDNIASATTTVNSGLDLSGSAAFVIRKAFQESGDTFLIDQIRIGDSFSDVASSNVPEPASIAIWSLIGLCLTWFGYYRIRRQ